MRVFGVSKANEFSEFRRESFRVDHLEQTLEDWLEANPGAILEDGRLLLIGRQVTTSLGTFIDLMAVDADGAVVVIELKRDRTPRDTIAQALEYASFAAELEYDDLNAIFQEYSGEESTLAEYHRAYFDHPGDRGVSFNKEQRIVIVANEIVPVVKKIASYLRRHGLRVTCLGFEFFRASSGERLLSTDIVVGQEIARPTQVSTGRLRRVDRSSFLASCEPDGRVLFGELLDACDQHDLAIHWGSKGCSLNAEVDGLRVPIFYCYPPSAMYGQAIYTGIADILRKMPYGEEVVQIFRTRLEELGCFVPAGQELKCPVDGTSGAKIDPAVLRSVLLEMARKIVEVGVQQTAHVPSDSPDSEA